MAKSKKDQDVDALQRIITVTESLSKSISAFTATLQPALKTTMDIQQQLISFGYTTPSNKLLDMTIPEVPGMTNLVVATNLLRFGLDRNSQSVGKYLARSQLLGENIGAISQSIVSLSNSLALSDKAQAEFVKTIYDASKQYNVSSEKIIAAVAKLAENLPAQAALGNQNLIKALGTFEAQLGPGAEGLISKSIMPFLTGGFETYQKSAILGIQPIIDRLKDPSRSISEMTSDLQELVALSSRSGKSFLQTIGVQEVINSNYKDIAQITQASARASQLLAERQQDPEKAKAEAKLADTEKALNALTQRIQEPIVNVSRNILKLVDSFGSFGGYFVTIIAGIGMLRLLFNIYSALNGILTRLDLLIRQSGGNAPANMPSGFSAEGIKVRGTRIRRRLQTSKVGRAATRVVRAILPTSALAGLGKIFTGALGIVFGPIGALIAGIASVLPIWEWIGLSSEKTADEVEDIPKEVPKPVDPISQSRALLAGQAALIGALMNVRETDNLAKQLKNSEVQRQLMLEQNLYLKDLTEGFKRIEDKSSPLSNPTLARRGFGGF